MLVFVVGLLIVSHALSQPLNPWSFSWNATAPVPLLSNTFLFSLNWLTAIGGITIGAWLVFREDLGKTWPFLIHRPVSSSTLLAAKVATAAALYFAALLIPLSLMTLACAFGRYPAPWSIQYVFPGFGIVLGGFAFTMATMLCGLRHDAKWYVSRFLPLPLVAVFFLFGNIVSSVPTANFSSSVNASFTLVGWTLVLSFLAAAMWNTFTNRPAIGRGALALVLSGGVAVVVTVVVMLLSSFVPSLESDESPHREVVWTERGEPLIMATSWRNNYRATLSELDGTVIKTSHDYQTIHEGLSPSVAFQVDDKRQSAILAWLQSEHDVKWLNNPSLWDSAPWYLFATPSDRVSVYDAVSGRLLGYWGENGFDQSPEAVTPFNSIKSGAYWKGALFLQTSDAIWELDNETKHCERVFSGDVKELQLAQGIGVSSEPKRLFCRLDGEIAVRDLTTGKDTTYTFPKNVRPTDGGQYLTIASLADDKLGITVRDNRAEPDEGTFLAKLAPGGKMVFSKDVTLYPSPSKQRAFWAMCYGLFAAINPLVPGVGFGAALLFNFDETTHSCQYFIKDAHLRIVFSTFAVAALILCPLATMLTLRRRVPELKRRLLWAGFTILTGFSGLAAVWILFLSEKNVPCPSCGKKRPPSQDHCPCCRAPWPPPSGRDVDLIIDAE